jgi:hypothetical protein
VVSSGTSALDQSVIDAAEVDYSAISFGIGYKERIYEWVSRDNASNYAFD